MNAIVVLLAVLAVLAVLVLKSLNIIELKLDRSDDDIGCGETCNPGPVTGTCVNPKRPPTCYVSASTSNHVCGPGQGPNDGCAAGYGCYILGRTANCCNFCPPEMAGIC